MLDFSSVIIFEKLKKIYISCASEYRRAGWEVDIPLYHRRHRCIYAVWHTHQGNCVFDDGILESVIEEKSWWKERGLDGLSVDPEYSSFNLQ